MARKPRTNADPFNADDPVMPWDESGSDFVPLGSDRPDYEKPRDHDDCWVDDDEPNPAETRQKPERKRSTKRVASKSSGDGSSKAERSKKPSGGSDAPRSPEARPSWPAPKSATTKLKPATPKGGSSFESGGAPGKGPNNENPAAPGRRKMSPAARIIMLIVLLTVGVNAITLVVSCSAALIGAASDGVSGLFEDDYDYYYDDGDSDSSYPGLEFDTYTQVRDELAAQQLSRFNSLVESALAGDDELAAKGAGYLDTALDYYCDLSYADLGIDSVELARWALASVERGETRSNAYSENDEDTVYSGTCSESMAACDVDEVAWQLASYLHELTGYDASMLVPGNIDEEIQSLAQSKLESLKAETEKTDVYLSLDFTGSCDTDGSNPVATLDEATWENQFPRLLGLYWLYT